MADIGRQTATLLLPTLLLWRRREPGSVRARLPELASVCGGRPDICSPGLRCDLETQERRRPARLRQRFPSWPPQGVSVLRLVRSAPLLRPTGHRFCQPAATRSISSIAVDIDRRLVSRLIRLTSRRSVFSMNLKPTKPGSKRSMPAAHLPRRPWRSSFQAVVRRARQATVTRCSRLPTIGFLTREAAQKDCDTSERAVGELAGGGDAGRRDAVLGRMLNTARLGKAN